MVRDNYGTRRPWVDMSAIDSRLGQSAAEKRFVIIVKIITFAPLKAAVREKL